MNRLMLADVVSVLGWRIVNGTKYRLDCYGPAARFLDFYDDECEPEWHATLVFDRESTRVMEISAYRIVDSDPCQPWRWIDPSYRSAYLAECAAHSVSPTVAWDEVDYDEIEDASMAVSALKSTVSI